MYKSLVSKSVAALMLNPDIESEKADEVLHGMVVEVEKEEKNGWYLVKTHYGYYGYIHRDDVLQDSKIAEDWKHNEYVIWKMIADVMAEPKYASYTLQTLVRGCRVKYTGEFSDKWEKIGLADGSFGWIRKGFARVIKKYSAEEREESVRESIVGTALEYLGCQYRWGGKSPLGIDCSGLSSMAYMLNGIIIPRDAGLQEKYLKPIEREAAKPGDLFFFPGHVALCIGNGRYVHSTSKEGYVVINSFNHGSEEYREDLEKELRNTGTIF